MKCKEILKKIEENYPLERAEAWDNPGLLVGNQEQEVKKIFLALDVTDETLEAAVSASLCESIWKAGNTGVKGSDLYRFR